MDTNGGRKFSCGKEELTTDFSNIKRFEIDPEERLEILEKVCCSMEMDPSVPLSRYYVTGIEMDGIGHKFLKERSFENAFVFFQKYTVLFRDKVLEHPEHASTPEETRKIVENRMKELVIVIKCLREVCVKKYARERDAYFRQLFGMPDAPGSDKRASVKPAAKEEGDGKKPCELQIEAAQAAKEKRVRHPTLRCQRRFPTPEDAKSLDKELPPPTSSQVATPWMNVQNCFAPRQLNEYPETVMLKVMIPANLCKRFLLGARENNILGVETLALLCGRKHDNEVTITHLVYPKQEGTPNSVTIHGEEEVGLMECRNKLRLYGWIHTHPGETANLSTGDLHVQYMFQKRCASFISIVCAPKFNKTMYATLTCTGLKVLESCTDKQLTHPHPEEERLYANAHHYVLSDCPSLTEIDFRDIEPQPW